MTVEANNQSSSQDSEQPLLEKSISFLGDKLCHELSPEPRESVYFSQFKTRIKSRIGEECTCDS